MNDEVIHEDAVNWRSQQKRVMLSALAKDYRVHLMLG